jgi:hypothetical protein
VLRPFRIFKSSLRVLGLLLVFACIAEQGLRIQKFGMAGFSRWEMSTITHVLMSDFAIEPPQRDQDTMGKWGLMPNTRGHSMGVPFEVNNFGLRGSDTTRAKPEGALRIAVVGGSLTMAAGVPLAKTWPEVLELKLNAAELVESEWEVLNLGVPNTRRCLAAQLERALYFEPDFILWQIGHLRSVRGMNHNLKTVAKFAESHSVQVFAFALDNKQLHSPSNPFYELLPPLDVEYGPENFVYPSDSHADAMIHGIYGKRVFARLQKRHKNMLAVLEKVKPIHNSTFKPLDPNPWINPERGFSYSYLWERLRRSFTATSLRASTMDKRLPWNRVAKDAPPAH